MAQRPAGQEYYIISFLYSSPLAKTICFRDVRTLIEKHFKIQFHALEVHEPRDKRGPMNVDILTLL